MPTLTTLTQIWDGLLDLIYPQRCLLCERDREPPICDDCYASFTAIPEPTCAVCGRPLDETDSRCRFCAEASASGNAWSFAAARAASVYDGPLRQAIHRLKYNRIEALGPALGAHLANRCIADGLFSEAQWKSVDLVVPMPLQARRRRRRGFNQSELLAAPLAEMIGVPLDIRSVRRERRTAPQVGLSLQARRQNLSGRVFRVVEPAAVAGKTILLVDDVFTSGATVDACARELRDNGAVAVLVATLASGG